MRANTFERFNKLKLNFKSLNGENQSLIIEENCSHNLCIIQVNANDTSLYFEDYFLLS